MLSDCTQCMYEHYIEKIGNNCCMIEMMLLLIIQYSGHVFISCVVWKHSPMMMVTMITMISAKVQMKRTQSWEARVSLVRGLLPQNEPCLSEDMRAVTHPQIAVGLNSTPIPPSLINVLLSL